ncbi:degenerin unc-8-like [Ruditapes philippinarum]|uniref:degenerin unc-8-like n=1 Tax=Ruditapes philippinarum TaxID=129788 RepID=UPI00295B9097|nr:degenerin unc-8-like [Ruditapes philippinarum]
MESKKEIKDMFKSENHGEKVEKKTFKEILTDLVEGSSLHGIPKIISSRQLAVKALWCLLFLATFSVLVIQLSGLFKTYYSHPIQTTVSLEFNSITFPAISICNMNPVRNSKLSNANALQNILNAASSTGRKKRSIDDDVVTVLDEEQSLNNEAKAKNTNKPNINVERYSPNYIQPTPVLEMKSSEEHIDRLFYGPLDESMYYQESSISYLSSSESRPEPTFPFKGVRRRKRFVDPSSLLSSQPVSLPSSVLPSVPLLSSAVNSLVSSVLPSTTTESSGTSSDWLDEWTAWYSANGYYASSYYDNGYDTDSWSDWSDPNAYIFSQLSSKKDIWDERVEQFQNVFKNESLNLRQQMGHQKEDMIMSASFAGSLENISYFQNFSSSKYGNCFTVSSPRYVAWRSGPSHGIKMTLNLEIDEYVSNFSTGYGVRLLLHEPGTYPLPTDEGITLGPGTETNIGLKMVRISRLGKPYSNCVKGVDFAKLYKKKYSVSACYHFCRIRKAMQVCKCIPVDAPDEINLNSTALPVCNNSIVEEKKCLLTIDIGFNNGNYECDCNGPCKEVVFEQTMSSRYWPTHEYMDVLMSELCAKNRSKEITQLKAICEKVDNLSFEDYDKYRQNFLRVIIYFEDLNYETISQEPLYESVRFLSDIGGAMGLFLGASVLSLVEVLQLLLEIVLYIWGRLSARNVTPVTSVS